MALRKRETDMVAEIAKKYGQVIDLRASPAVLVEILRTYGKVLDPTDGTGGVSPTTIAGSGGVSPGVKDPPPPPPPPKDDGDVRVADVMTAVLNLQRDVKAISRKLNPGAK